MATRNLRNYFGINTKSPHANNRFALRAEEGRSLPTPTKKSIARALDDYLQNNLFAWFIHDLRVKPAYTYPTTITADSIYILKNQSGEKNKAKIAICADWASDTPQSQFVGFKMDEQNPDYTIHLGDTYYSGKENELINNFGKGGADFGLWPRGRVGSFALAGNHEMFSSGRDYYNMITESGRSFGERIDGTGSFTGQAAPCFCLESDHWCILGLDTGYNSLKTGWLRLHPDNLSMQLPDTIIRWLKDEVKIAEKKKGIIVFTHHQYVTAFKKQDEFFGPAKQLEELIPGREIIWIWGHEHRFAMYGKIKKSGEYISAFGRCIGNGGMPDEHINEIFYDENKADDYRLVVFDRRVAEKLILPSNDAPEDERWTEDVGYNGFAVLNIDNENLAISYYQSYWNGETNLPQTSKEVFVERWTADKSQGTITFQGAEDKLVSQPTPQEQLTYYGTRDAMRVGK